MIIGDRLRAIREEKKLSQGDIEKRTGLLRCYVSRVENGHTVPAIETLEKMARALEIPLYQLFYDGEKPPPLPPLPNRRTAANLAWGSSGRRAALREFIRKILRVIVGKLHNINEFLTDHYDAGPARDRVLLAPGEYIRPLPEREIEIGFGKCGILSRPIPIRGLASPSFVERRSATHQL